MNNSPDEINTVTVQKYGITVKETMNYLFYIVV